MTAILNCSILGSYLPAEGEEMQYKVNSFSILNIPSINTQSLAELLFVGLLANDQLVKIDTSQVSNTSNQGLVIWGRGL